MTSPIVRSIAWGHIEVDGLGAYKDVVLFPGGAHEWDWGRTGTRHSPGIQPADVMQLVAAGARAVVLSLGMDLVLQVMPETLELLEAKGITVHVLESREAVRVYNELAATTAVGALIHSTC